MNTSKKTKVNSNKKSKLSQKSKTRKNLSGGGIFSPNPAVFKNLVYPKSYSGYSGIPELQCSICKKNVFKMRTMKIATWKKAVFFDDIWDNRFKFFTCTNCGKVEILSSRVTLQQIDVGKK
jgi:predicted nucleic-acid-binding Zn-ribbon protein